MLLIAARVDILYSLLLLTLQPAVLVGVLLGSGGNNTTLDLHDSSVSLRLQELEQLGLNFKNESKASDLNFWDLKPAPVTSKPSDNITKNYRKAAENGNVDKHVLDAKAEQSEDEEEEELTCKNTSGVRRFRQRGHRIKRQFHSKKKEHECSLRIVMDSYFMTHVVKKSPYNKDLNLSIASLVQFVDYQLLNLNSNKGKLKNLGLRVGELVQKPQRVGKERNAENKWDPKAFFEELAAHDFAGYCAGLLFTYQQLDPAYTPAGGVSMVDVDPHPKAGACTQGIPPKVKKPTKKYSAHYRNALPVNFRKGTNGLASSYVIMAQMVHQLSVILGAYSDRSGSKCFTKEIDNYATAFPIPQTLSSVNQEISSCAKAHMEAAENKTSKCLQPCKDECEVAVRPRLLPMTPTTPTTTSTTSKTTSTTTSKTTSTTTSKTTTTPTTTTTTPTTTTTTPTTTTTRIIEIPLTNAPINEKPLTNTPIINKPLLTLQPRRAPVNKLTFSTKGWTETCVTVASNSRIASSHLWDSVAHALMLLLSWLVAASVVLGFVFS